MLGHYKPSLMDRLVDHQPGVADARAERPLSLGEVKDSVARDLEALLNTRSNAELMSLSGPLLTSSLLAFGIPDFSDRSLLDTNHRAEICRAIETAIRHHEPRLKDVQVELDMAASLDNRLHFRIHALLIVDRAQEAVNFDAHLQPLTLQYDIARGGAARFR